MNYVYISIIYRLFLYFSLPHCGRGLRQTGPLAGQFAESAIVFPARDPKLGVRPEVHQIGGDMVSTWVAKP